MPCFENLDVVRLELRSSLYYYEDRSLVPFGTADTKELLFCFEIEEETGKAIDPDTASYLGSPVFSGRICTDAAQSGSGGLFELSAGAYFFAQTREALNREECILMAIEVQREILWQRLQPQNQLHIRNLFEDGKPVTQVWRAFRT
jgi:hypothetical protein